MTSRPDPPDCHVVVRTAGERTVSACLDLVGEQVPADRFESLEIAPFAAALRTSYERGVASGRKFLLCVDGDVLLRPGAVADLVAAGERALARDPSRFATLEGRIADKLLGKKRIGGGHLYWTERLPRILADCEITDRQIRPERHVKDQLSARGFEHQTVDTVVGLHDFEQFYADILRKAIVHCRKFPLEVEHAAAAAWRRAAEDPEARDDDLRVASWALHLEPLLGAVRIDRREFPRTIEPLLHLAGLREKPPLATVSSHDVARRLDAFRETPEALRWRAFQRRYQRGRLGPVRAVLGRYGAVGSIAHLGAKAFRGLAARLESLAGD